ncbi:hypothetical protein [Streptomyces sp. SA15]|nr:hypothetical protein [Streptomyces sp. SA15]
MTSERVPVRNVAQLVIHRPSHLDHAPVRECVAIGAPVEAAR